MLLADSEDHQEIVDGGNKTGKQYNMKMNAQKTISMVISKRDSQMIKIFVDGVEIDEVKSFNYRYLRQKITEDGRCKEDIIRRIGITKTSFSKISGILTTSRIPLKTRTRILHGYVWSTSLYGAETWKISKPMRERLNGFEVWCFRKVLKIKWIDRIINRAVLNKINTPKRLYSTTQTRTLMFFDHMMRKDL